MKALHSAKYGRFAKHSERKTAHGRRFVSLLLCLCMVVSIICGAGIMTASSVESGPTANIVPGSRVADLDTMDDYLNRLLTAESGSRYAGRVWTDKTVFAYGNSAARASGSHFDGNNTITLDMLTDGYDGNVRFNADFAHVFSTLASSQVSNEAVTSPLDLVILLDMSGSMGADIHQGEEGHGYWETIGSNVGHIVTFSVGHINYGLWSNESYPLRIYTSSYTGDNTSTYWVSVKAVKSDENENEYIVNEIYPYNTNKRRITLNSNEILISAFQAADRANLSMIAVNDTLTLSGINVSAGTITGDASVSVDRKEIKRWHQDEHTDLDERISHSRIASVLDSINTAIDQLMEMNETNRVTVVGYGGTAATILPLGHYQKREGQNYLSATDFTTYGSSTVKDKDFTGSSAYTVNSHADMVTIENGKITATEPIDKEIRNDYEADGTTGTTLIGFHTNLQAGIYEGFNNLYETLENIDDATYTYHSYTTGKDSVVPRIPVAFVMSDGGSNYAVKAPTAAKGGNGSEWYDLTVPSSLSGGWNAYDTTDSKKYRAENPNAAGGDAVILDILLTASYMKSKIQNKYTELLHTAGLLKDGEKSDFEIHTVSVDTPTDDYQIPRVYAGLDPKDFFKSGTDLKAVAGIATDPTTWKYKDSVTSAYDHFNTWKTDSKGTTITFSNSETREGVNGSVTVNYNKLPDDHVGVTNEDVENNILYNDSFADIGATDLAETFKNLIARFDVPVFTPISGDNDAGVNNSITYQDPLGEYMEIKDGSITATPYHVDGGASHQNEPTTYDMSLLVFGEMHGIVRVGVYDYQWNDQYMRKHPEAGTHGEAPFPVGWYLGDNPETAVKADQANIVNGDGGTYPSQNNEGTEHYTSANDARAHGWVFRLDFNTLIQFVPIVDAPENGLPQNLSPQVMNTKYTIYRFAGSQDDRNELHRNPIYGDVPADLEAKWKEAYDAVTKQYPADDSIYSETPGVYRLSDIRVWVEDTGDFTDTSGAIAPNSGYDRSLYVNIPAAAIPAELATITLGEDGVTAYQTNLGSDHKDGTDIGKENQVTYKEYCYQSTPFRLFYSVGLEDDLLLHDAAGNQVGVDLNAVSPEYIQAHTAENGNVWFISNYYSETRYGDYTTDGTSRTRGDATVTFSPDIDNRYYVFQKPLPLYAHAYRVSTDYAGAVDFKTTDPNFTWEKAEAEGQSNGSTTWEEYDGQQQQASSWVGGQFMGVYKTREAFYDALQTWNSEGRTGKIKDSHGNLYEFVNGGIIFSEEDLLDHVTTDAAGNVVNGSHSFSSDDYYFILLEFYEPIPGTTGYDKDGNEIDGATGGKFVQYALTRKGSEFGSGYASSNISNGDMLCWTDMNGMIDTNFAYMSTSDTGDRTRGEPTFEKLTTKDQGDLRTYLKDKCGISETQMMPNPAYVDETKTPGIPKERKVLDLQVEYWLERQNDSQVQAALAAAKAKAVEDGNDDLTKENFTTYFQFALATRPGGVRSGDMYNNLQYKGTYDAETGYYDKNNTKTSNTYYLPTISNNSGTDNNVIINNFLGNNGRLEIANQTLHVTKMLVPPGGFTLTEGQKDEVFNYQISIQGVTGTRTAVKTEYNEYAESWERELGYIDVLTDNSDLVQTNNSTRALFVKEIGTTSIGTNSVMAKQVLWDDATGAYYYANEDGTLPTDAEGNAIEAQRVPMSVIGESNEYLYYMYLPSNGSTSTGTEHVHRLYQAEDYDGADKIEGDLLGRNGMTTFVSEGDSTTPSEPGEANRNSKRTADTAHSPGTKTYWNLDAELIPKSVVDEAEAINLPMGSPGEPGGFAIIALEVDAPSTWTHDKSTHAVENHETLTYHDFFVRRPVKETSESEFTSPYKSRTQYLTVTLNFGQNANANDGSTNPTGSLTATDLYDNTPFGTLVGEINYIDRLLQITAEFTLKHGEGLMFSGLSGSNYRFTEKLTEMQMNEGYTLKEVKHIQQNSQPTYGADHFAETPGLYSVNGDTGDGEEQIHYTNTIDPDLFVLTKTLVDADGKEIPASSNVEFTFYVTFSANGDEPMSDRDTTLHIWRGNKEMSGGGTWTDKVTGVEHQMPTNAPRLDEYQYYLNPYGEFSLETINPVEATDTTPKNTYKVTVKPGEAVVFYGLIAGTDYSVREEVNPDYPVYKDPVKGNENPVKGTVKRASADSIEIAPTTTDNRVDFKNEMRTGALTVEKEIRDDDKWEVDKNFTFTVTLTAGEGKSLNAEDLTVTKYKKAKDETKVETSEDITKSVAWTETTAADGRVTELTADITLMHGEGFVIGGIPMGTKYTVKETGRNGYNLEYVVDVIKTPDITNANNFIHPEDFSTGGEITEEQPQASWLFVNAKPLEMPFTGGIGRDMFFIIGAAFIVSGIVFMNFCRKRRVRVK